MMYLLQTIHSDRSRQFSGNKMKPISVTIDTSALMANFKRIKQMTPDSRHIAVVKANAYGHGLVRVARVLESLTDAFAVSRIDEAEILRQAGIRSPIVLLEGFFNASDVNTISKLDLYTAVHDLFQARAIAAADIDKPVHCWVQVDIGMHRLGSNDPKEIAQIKSVLENTQNAVKPLGLISHLSVADTPSETEYNKKEINNFFDIVRDLGFDGDLCLANSAGICRWERSHTTWVRPGIIMYGISPFEDNTGRDLGLTPVMTLKSSIIAIHKLKKGDKVGYGAAFVAPRDTVLGVVSAGYGDGYPRTAQNGTPVLVNGRIVPTAGHVCMDMLFVDLGPDARDQVGDPVELWGPDLPVEHVASHAGTIPYELVCRIMPRVEVSYI